MHDEHPNAAAPEEPRERRAERSADEIAEAERQRQAGEDPEEKRAVDEADRRVGDQVRGVAVALTALGVDEQPADVSVEEPAQCGAPPASVADVGAVRVALLVGERVMLA